jgi:hypothetical protein
MLVCTSNVLIINGFIVNLLLLGSIYYYTLTGSYWSRQAKLLANDGVYSDMFGVSASIYNNNALIGAQNDDDKNLDAGTYIK